MPDEDKVVSHEDLDAAVDAHMAQPEEPHAEPVEEPVETPVEDVPEEEPTGRDALLQSTEDPGPTPAIPAEPDPDDPEGHKARSKLGREVKSLKEDNEALKASLSRLEALLTPKEPEEEEDDGEPVFYTKTELREIIRKESQSIAQETIDAPTKKQIEYEQKYIRQLDDIDPDADPELRKALLDEVTKPGSKFCITRSGHKNPEMDAATNYYAAKASYYETKSTEKKHGLKQETPGGMGGPSGIEIPPKIVAPVELNDPHARALAEQFFTTEEVSGILSKPIPARLYGKI